MTLDEFLGRLEKVKRSGGGHMARCPAHDDSTASLGVDDGKDRVLVKCHANCTTESVVAAMGLEMKDLFYEERKREEPEAIYDYLDADGNLVHQKLRFPDKRFLQRRPDGAGDWVWSLKDIEPVLYRLPEVVEALGKRKIFITEGEKDADAIVAAGGVATCNPEGAGKWRDSYVELLAGAHLVIVADKDGPEKKYAGQRHAKLVAQRMGERAASIQIVQAREGKDAHDHLSLGYALADFDRFEDPDAPGAEPQGDGLVLQRASNVRSRDVEWVDGYQNMLAFGAITTLFGPPGVNKSTLSVLIASTVTYLQGHPAIFFSAEDSFEMVMRPRLQAVGANLDLCMFAAMRRDGFESSAAFPSDLKDLEKAMRTTGARYVVIDPVSAHLDGTVDGHSDQSMRRALAPIGKLAERMHASVLLISHLNKGRSSDPMMRAGGSIGLPGISRMCLLMEKHPELRDDPNVRVVVGFKNNWGPDAHARVYRLESVPQTDLVEPPIVLRDFGTSYHTARQLLAANLPKHERGGD